MHDEDKVRMALGIYALFRTVIYCSAEHTARPIIPTLLRLWVKRAAEGSKSQTLLMH